MLLKFCGCVVSCAPDIAHSKSPLNTIEFLYPDNEMTTESTTPIPQETNQILAERRAKLAAIRKEGVAFPNDFARRNLAADLHAEFDGKSKEELETAEINVAVAGRMMLKRVMGKASFATIQDMSGRIQLFISNGDTGEAAHDAFKHYDLGDILGASGMLFKTKTGELSVRVTSLRLLTKALRPLPEKFHGLTDQEQKYRQRYVDLITNEETRKTFMIRSKVIQAMREFFVRHGYLEVETPMMHPIPGGAAAKPFITHHNALDMGLYLRIAPELYLKRLVVGGFEKVFEINRNFRNEGLSTRHNPEFTMVEFYEAYRDYRYLMDFTEAMFREVTQQVLGTTTVSYQGREFDMGKPFERLTITGAIRKYHPQFSDTQLNDRDFLINELQDLKAKYKPADHLGGLQLSLFEELSEHQLFEPTFIIDYPIEVSPLARASDTRPGITERFELFIAGREIANGFSELNDPEDQEARFDAQVAAKEAGDEEAMFKDADYIRALEYGLPPTAGEGIGIDRLVMLLTDAPSIRDVILFPHMRPE
jgi:lysyl-tRNA synthetase, class II